MSKQRRAELDAKLQQLDANILNLQRRCSSYADAMAVLFLGTPEHERVRLMYVDLAAELQRAEDERIAVLEAYKELDGGQRARDE